MKTRKIALASVLACSLILTGCTSKITKKDSSNEVSSEVKKEKKQNIENIKID